MIKKIILACICLIILQTSKAQEIKNDTILVDKVIAIVGNEIIKLSDIENQYLQYVANGYDGAIDGKCTVFEQLLYQKLLLNQAQLDSLVVEDKEVDSELDRRLEDYIERAQGKENLEKHFKKSILHIKQDMKEIVHDQLVTEKMNQKINEKVKIAPSEVFAYFKKIPKDSLPLINSEMEIGQIIKYPEISQEEKDLVKKRLEEIKEKILNNKASFASQAALYSEDPGSGASGGDLGFRGRGDFVPEFSAAGFSLDSGQISKVVETEYGFHLIQMVEKRGEQARLRHILLIPKPSANARQKAKNQLDSIATLIRIDTLTFEQAASKYSDDDDSKYNGGLMVNPYTGSTRFQMDQLDANLNQKIKNYKIGQMSEPFETSDRKGKGCMKIVMLKTKTKPHTANLTDDYQLLQDMALNEKKQKSLDNWIQKKQESTYIHIDKSFQNCSFRFKRWLK